MTKFASNIRSGSAQNLSKKSLLGSVFVRSHGYMATEPQGVLGEINTAIGLHNAADSESVSILPDFSDPDGESVTYTATGLPAGLTIDPETGEIFGTLDNSAAQGGPVSDGDYTISVTADDGAGGSVTDFFILTVTNPVPVAKDDALSSDESKVTTGTIFGENDNGLGGDPDGDLKTVTDVGGDRVNVEAVSVDMATGKAEQVGTSYSRAVTLSDQFAIHEHTEMSKDKGLLMALAE